MRYPAEQKTQTHERIVNAAAGALRAKGLHGIGIAELMSQLGLTHGGFYAHFKNRDALVAEALATAAAESIGRLTQAAQSASPGREVDAMLEFYLSPAHRDDHAHGCLLPALASELARQPRQVRNAFTASLKANLAKISCYMPAKDSGGRLAQAMAFVSGMAGGILLARSVNDAKVSGLLLASVRAQLAGQYGSRRA